MKIRTRTIPITDCTKLVDLERPVYGMATLPHGERVHALLKRDGGHVRYENADGNRIDRVLHFDYDPPQLQIDYANPDEENRSAD
jgi:hypothetical protein